MSNGISGRFGASVLALLLAAFACSPNGPASGEGPGRSPTPQAIRIGGEGAPEGTPAPAGPAVSANDPVEVVRTLLGAIEAEDYDTQLRLSTGAVHVLMRIRDVIQQHNERSEAATDERVEVVDEPALLSRDGDDANVSLRARIDSVVRRSGQPVRSRATVTGPVRVVRLDRGWSVADLVYTGRPLDPFYRPVDRRRGRNGVVFELGAVLSYKRTTAALVRLLAEGDEEIDVEITGATLVVEGADELPLRQLAFESRTAPAIFLRFDRTEREPERLRLGVQRADGESWMYDIAI